MNNIDNDDFGSIIKTIAICNKCNTETGSRLFKLHSCSTCNAWVSDVRYKSIRMFVQSVI